MTAPLSISGASHAAMCRPVEHQLPSQGTDDDAGKRMMSVSPNRLASARKPVRRDSKRPMFMTPRVVDQQALDELASMLRDLITEATDAAQRLSDRVRAAEDCEGRAAASSGQLQHRLRLGARMLSAFQSQLVRIESTFAELERRADSSEFEESTRGRAKSTLGEFEEQLDALVADQLARVVREVDAAADRSIRRFARVLHTFGEDLFSGQGNAGQSVNTAEMSEGAD